jgi:hypothetical protein
LAYSILEHVALQPKGGGYKVEDALKQLFTDNFSDITLQSAELSNFSSWVNGNVELLRKIGDNPVNIRVLSPELNELVKKAQGGDKEAWLLAENAYKDFVNSSPDLASIAPPKFYINQAQFPTTRLGDGTTFVNSVMTNVLQNGAVNTVSHASHQLKQGDIRDLELLRFQSEQLAANVIHSTNNPKAAEDAVSTLVSFYKSGTEFSKTADELYNNVYLQSQKFDKQDSGDVLPLIPLIEVYDNTGLPNKAEFYDTILRGYVNTYKVALAKLDDPEEQYEYIRDKLFEDTNVFPYVSITDGGGLVELPAEYNKYIDVRKDRTGLFGRFFEPAGRLLSDRESVKNVATVYSTAVISEMFDQNPSLNLDQILRDIREEVAPNIELDVSDPYVPVYAGGISAPETTQQKARREKKLKLRTREALIKGLMNNQVDGMPLARITTELQNDDEGNPQKVAILSVINKDGVYEPLARSPEDRRPVSASLDKVDVVMNSAMPRITTFMLGGSREDEAGVKTSMMGTPYYLRQLFGAEDTYISGMVEDVHDQIYNKD